MDPICLETMIEKHRDRAREKERERERERETDRQRERQRRGREGNKREKAGMISQILVFMQAHRSI